MKGVMGSTLSVDDFDKNPDVKISLKVNHLSYWYLQPMPTYLALYIESTEKFLVLNIQKYVTDKWRKSILTLPQETAKVSVPKESELDVQAFRILLAQSDIGEWQKVLEAEEDDIRVCRRDYDLIWHIGTSEDRHVEHRILFMDWQSKTKSQCYIGERIKDSAEEWHTLREHWQYQMNIFDLEQVYPYLKFFGLDPDEETPWWMDEEDDENNEVPDLTLSNGDVVHGKNAAWEYFEYKMGLRLNEIGKDMFDWVKTLEQIGLIEITPGKRELISVAPWHGREI